MTALELRTHIGQLSDATRDGLRDFVDRVHPDPRGHFRLLIPDGWIEARPRGVDRALGGAAQVRRFVAQNDTDVFAEVRLGRLEREVAPCDWLTHHVRRLGQTIIDEASVLEPTGRAAHLLSASSDGWIHRWWATKNGPHLFIGHGVSSADAHDAHADAIAALVAGLRPIDDTRAMLAEPHRTVTLDGGEYVAAFTALRSWNATHAVCLDDRAATSRAVDATHLRLRTDAGAVAAVTASLHIGSPVDAADVLEMHAARLGDAFDGLSGAPIVPLGVDPRGDRRWMTELSGRAEGTSFDLRAAFHGDERRGVLIAMATPRQSIESLTWEAARRAFDIACESVAIADVNEGARR